ncbi:gamma-mobile-trio protein GmtX [Herbaspirillum robiniae]|uniref:gamma-mobile-trio protein GmtX n=1 Tax=Herbaspirillum robiniae TaxID=2014887 RepID=UPI0011E4CC04|nr:gamma-mobile-trio protein GmtX [Herbaspirillum robiniae]
MTGSVNVDPNLVYQKLYESARHPAKRRNLELLQKICIDREKAGKLDFSLGAIGDEFESSGGPKAKVLWNESSADYRALIEAWQISAGAPKVREANKIRSDDGILKAIADPAVRIVVAQLIRSYKLAQVELNLLKQNSNIKIDLRQKKNSPVTGITADGTMTLEVSDGPKLNPAEREALEHAISQQLWDMEGWAEEKNGRVVKELASGRTRTIFKPGFATAIRRILDK